VVVEVDDHRGQDQALLAALGAGADRALEAVEQPVETLGVELSHLLGQAVEPLERGAERAGRAAAVIVRAERLLGPAAGPEPDRVGQLLLVVTLRRVHHLGPPRAESMPLPLVWEGLLFLGPSSTGLNRGIGRFDWRGTTGPRTAPPPLC